MGEPRMDFGQFAIAMCIAVVILLIGLISHLSEKDEFGKDLDMWQAYRLLRKAAREHLVVHIEAHTAEGELEAVGEVRSVLNDYASLRSIILRPNEGKKEYQRQKVRIADIVSVRVCERGMFHFVRKKATETQRCEEVENE